MSDSGTFLNSQLAAALVLGCCADNFSFHDLDLYFYWTVRGLYLLDMPVQLVPLVAVRAHTQGGRYRKDPAPPAGLHLQGGQ